jgi:SHS family lactate transporter-like MFS transporter|tara:strand:- start:14448 stop:15158 length:711 start_codon:yes stop_codon:yes gene_type:complete
MPEEETEWSIGVEMDGAVREDKKRWFPRGVERAPIFGTIDIPSPCFRNQISSLAMDAEKDHVAHRENIQYVEKISAGRYAATRLTTLKPARDKVPNPITLLRMLNLQQWLFFLVAFFAWSWDAFDFFTVSLTVENLAETFDKTKAEITWGITLVLMLRSVGSIIFGLAADRYGRKWPFIVNNVLFIILELATGFCSTYNQFLGVRALFGIAMGGLYGNAAATGKASTPYNHLQIYS